MDIFLSAIIFIIGILSGFIGAVSGGGGLVSVSALLLAGLPPQISIATSRLASIGLYASGIYKYGKSKKINFKLSLPLLISMSIGSYIGANILIKIDQSLLSKIAAFLLVCLLPIIIFKKYGVKKEKTTKLKKYFGIFLYLLIGIYAGFFGGGWGIFSMYIIISFFGLSFVEGSATDLFVGVFSAIVSLFIYFQAGIINFEFGIIMMFGMLIGGYFGARTAIKKGDNFVKAIFIVITLATIVKLLFF